MIESDKENMIDIDILSPFIKNGRRIQLVRLPFFYMKKNALKAGERFLLDNMGRKQ